MNKGPRQERDKVSLENKKKMGVERGVGEIEHVTPDRNKFSKVQGAGWTLTW